MTKPNHLPRDPGSLADPGQLTQLLTKLISKSLPFVFSRNLLGFSFQLPTPVPNNMKADGFLHPRGPDPPRRGEVTARAPSSLSRNIS